MSLSDRLRPDCEAAPWVIKEVKELERRLDAALDENTGNQVLINRLPEERDQALDRCDKWRQATGCLDPANAVDLITARNVMRDEMERQACLANDWRELAEEFCADVRLCDQNLELMDRLAKLQKRS